MDPNTKIYPIILVLLILFLMPAMANAGIIYVDASKADDNGDGLSWPTAKKYLQSALALATSGDEIWVAQGTYYPDEGAGQTDNDRNSTFQLKVGVSIYGGFVGGETSRDQRDWENNQTILSGDLDQSSTINGSDAYHVVIGANNAVLDGFVVTGGNANGNSPNNVGGGMLNSSSSPMVTNCNFSQNSAQIYGGGMSNDFSSPTVTNCTFAQNFVQDPFGGGGGMSNSSSSPTVTNCEFSGNSASFGGGMYNYNSSSSTVTNCTFSQNSASLGGGM
ncbi:hypothetical protein FJZ31_22290 [Candidatus Poribacteria bacterium]|nr:hypothetical protein [Candidatus Poribacteria bacterium]